MSQAEQLFEVFKDGEFHYAYDIVKETGIEPGTLYPIIQRLKTDGTLECVWQDSGSDDIPPRAKYRLSQ